MATEPIRLATRGSPLALAQADEVARLFAGRGWRAELVVVSTEGDRDTRRPIGEIARRGVFTSEVERAVLAGRADVAVHSAKDLPSSGLPPDLVLAAAPVRADVRDALVGAALDDLHPGAQVATGSARRRLQLGSLVPGVRFIELRGNIGTRLARLPPGGAVVVARAALDRLGLADRAAQTLSVDHVLPQVGQGVIALRCRVDDDGARRACASVDDAVVHRALRAERAFLARLGGGCDAPVAAYGTVDGDAIELRAVLGAEGAIVRARGRGDDPEALGSTIADEIRSRAAGT